MGRCVFVVFFSLLLAGGCDSRPSVAPKTPFAGSYPIKATVTVGMVADLVRQIGGEHVEVTQLVSSGVDPHLFKTSRDDAVAIRDADIVIYSGLMLEGKMGEVLEQYSQTKRTFAAAESLPADRLGQDPDQKGHPDPHVWMDVSMWSQVAEQVGLELASFDPPHADDYLQSATELRARLAKLHAYGVEVSACIPSEQRVLVTSHDAFRYFGKAYGIEVQAIQGISTESEAGLSRINELVDLLVARKVGSIFTESSVPKDSIRALLRGAQARGHSVRIADKSLLSDAMGSEGTYEGTYIGMMDHNLTTIARALGCQSLPKRGFRDWESQQQAEKLTDSSPSEADANGQDESTNAPTQTQDSTSKSSASNAGEGLD